MRAQSVSVVTPAPSEPFVDPDSLRNVPGHTSFSTYVTQGECFEAMRLAHVVADSSAVKDTLPLWQYLDTLPSSARAVGVMCEQQFAAARVPTRELFNAFILAEQTGDSARAAAALEQWLAAKPMLADQNESPTESQAARLAAAMQIYLMFPGESDSLWNIHVHRAQLLLQRLDNLGPTVVRWQAQEHLHMVDVTFGHEDSVGQWKPEQDWRMVAALLARLDTVPINVLQQIDPLGGQTLRVLVRALQARRFMDTAGFERFADSLQKGSPLVAMAFKILALSKVTAELARAGTVATTLTGQYWYSPQGNTVWPQPGHLSLLVVEDGLGDEDLGILRRLAATYGSRGLEITIVAKTYGYNRCALPGLVVGIVPVAQEAADDSACYLGYRKLPVTLVVMETPLVRQADGHVTQSAPVAYEAAYGARARFVLSDQTGHIVTIGDRDFGGMSESEARLDAYIDRALTH